MNDRLADSEDPNDDDWEFEENSHDPHKYSNSRNDLSESINAGQRVRDLRMLDGLSVDELARRMEVPSSQVLALEAGMLQLDAALAERIATAFELSVTDIWGGHF